MADPVVSGADLFHHIQMLQPGSQALADALTCADLATLRVTHSLLLDLVLGNVSAPAGSSTRRLAVIAEIRRREAAL